MSTLRTLAAGIWENKITREAFLLIVSALSAQFVFSAAQLVAIVDEAKSWTDLWSNGTAWALAFSFAAVQTLIKQAVAYGLSRAANKRLAGAASSSVVEIRRELQDLNDRELAELGLRRVGAAA